MMMIWFKESLSSTCAGVCCSETQGANSTLSRTDIDLHQRLLYDDDGDDDDGGGGDDDGDHHKQTNVMIQTEIMNPPW